MANLRNLGYIINTLLANDNSKKEELCKELNFSEIDLQKLVSGRLSLNPIQISKVANTFSVTPDYIVNYTNNDRYSSMVHCKCSFSSQDNCDEILDIIDSYIDIKEAAI